MKEHTRRRRRNVFPILLLRPSSFHQLPLHSLLLCCWCAMKWSSRFPFFDSRVKRRWPHRRIRVSVRRLEKKLVWAFRLRGPLKRAMRRCAALKKFKNGSASCFVRLCAQKIRSKEILRGERGDSSQDVTATMVNLTTFQQIFVWVERCNSVQYFRTHDKTKK